MLGDVICVLNDSFDSVITIGMKGGVIAYLEYIIDVWSLINLIYD